jgi:hypothetical protein
MKKQTAVEWLISVLAHNDILDHNKVSSNKQLYNLYQRLKDQAKAMEKEQHCTTYINAMKECMINPLGDELYLEDAKEYYNETYGGDK